MFDGFSLTSLAVIPVLGLLIFLHELGHFFAARWMGVRVLEFGFGYPPKMTTLFTRNGVEYTLNWLPFGGFVRMAGEDDDFEAQDSIVMVAPWRRMIVMFAGPFMNVVTAVVFFAILLMAGIPEWPVKITGVAPGSPAAVAGLLEEDAILAVNGDEVIGIDAVSKAIADNAGQKITMTVLRGDEEVTVSLVPRLPDAIPAGQGASGIQISQYNDPDRMGLVYAGPVEALTGGVQRTREVTALMVGGLSDMLRGWLSPNVDGPEGGVGGLVAIGRITAEVAREGWRDLLNLTAFLSLNLAILNLLPIPALDGGRIVFAFVEMVRRKRIPPEKEAIVHFAGYAVLLALMVVITFVDVSNWIAGRPPIPGG